MFCPYCGEQHPSDAKFCPKTGKALSVRENRSKWTYSGIIILIVLLAAGGLFLYDRGDALFFATASPQPSDSLTAPAAGSTSNSGELPSGCEQLTVSYADGMEAVTSKSSYQGLTQVTSVGYGKAGGDWVTDSFYLFMDESGELNTPRLPNEYNEYILHINRKPAFTFIPGQAIPGYRNDHRYTFDIDAPGGQLVLGVNDKYFADNTGNYEITICAPAAIVREQSTPTALPEHTVLLEDDFSSPQWGTGTDADSSVEYADGALQMIVNTKNWFVWSTPDDQDYQDIHMEVTAINNDSDPSTAFGIMCNQQVVDDSFYYFAITPAGQYAIAEASLAATDVFLTNEDKWEYSDLIAKNADSYRIGADCGNGALTLYVDGQQVDSVQDDSYTNGAVALFVWSGEESTSANVSFDDFRMTAPK